MFDRLSSASAIDIAIGIGVFVFSIAFSIGLAAIVSVRIPADYFSREKAPLPLASHPRAVRIAAKVGLNLLGVVLVIGGILMSLPGVPGQGLLTILFGVMLLDIPGKRRLELAIIRRKMVRNAIDKMRARYAKPPLQIPEPDASPGSSAGGSAGPSGSASSA